MTRLVACVDMDCFFAAVEQLDDPALRARPVIVGGTGPRSVVAAASYESRVFGVRSAQPMSVALRNCPDAVVCFPRMDRYGEVSAQIMEVLSTVTPVVEPLSLDEAFLDVTGSAHLFGGPHALAEEIRQRVLDATGLTCSVGIAPNKSVAKLASESAKPQIIHRRVLAGAGVVIVEPDDIERFMSTVPLEKLYGAGPKTRERLARNGISTLEQLRQVDLAVLTSLLGRSAGQAIYDRCRGIDSRPVIPPGTPKSLSAETTFDTDQVDRQEIRRHLRKLARRVSKRVR